LLDIGQEETTHPFERLQSDHMRCLPNPFALGAQLKTARKRLVT
jgi:hypothetical protein